MPTTYDPILQKLLEKTVARKIDWKGTYDGNTFIAVVDDGFSFEVGYSRALDTHRFQLKDSEGNPVFVVSATAATGNSSVENDELYGTLSELWDGARTVALKLDLKIGRVVDILDKL